MFLRMKEDLHIEPSQILPFVSLPLAAFNLYPFAVIKILIFLKEEITWHMIATLC